MSNDLYLDRHNHPKGDTRKYDFSFAGLFPGGDTISEVAIQSVPSGLAAAYSLSGTKVTVGANTLACDIGKEYILVCTAQTSSLYTHTLAQVLNVVPNPSELAGATPIGGGGLTRKRYAVYLSQSGTNNPTTNIVVNGLTGIPAWTRQSEGTYRGVLAGEFPDELKTLIMPHLRIGAVGGEAFVDGKWIDANTIELKVRDTGGNLVDGFTNLLLVVEVTA